MLICLLPTCHLQVGHLKTIIILTGGCMFFGDQMPPKKLLGVAVAMVRLSMMTCCACIHLWLFYQLRLASELATGVQCTNICC